MDSTSKLNLESTAVTIQDASLLNEDAIWKL
jgi:hypothetical protein